MNKSEQLLKTWCSQNDWLCERIQVESECTPDFRIYISGTKLYAEVKEIVANKEELKVMRQLSERGYSDVYGEEPGKTVREKIKESYKQIKRFAEPEECSGVLVLYNNSGIGGLGRLHHEHVLTGMFGLRTVPVSIPNDPHTQPIIGSDYLGSKKSVTPTQNRYLSGIMVLYQQDDEKRLQSLFYHNRYAKYPIDPQLMNVNNCIQYKLSDSNLKWELVPDIGS